MYYINKQINKLINKQTNTITTLLANQLWDMSLSASWLHRTILSQKWLSSLFTFRPRKVRVGQTSTFGLIQELNYKANRMPQSLRMCRVDYYCIWGHVYPSQASDGWQNTFVTCRGDVINYQSALACQLPQLPQASRASCAYTLCCSINISYWQRAASLTITGRC